ncbi:MAG: fumarate hydratase C-terminal domain-containing protein [Gammaproteobacteria bacterium]
MGHDGENLKTVRLTTPVAQEDLAGLGIGNVVYLDGVIYTGREGVYKRIIDDGVPPPVELRELSNVNFHCSPAAAVNDDGSYNVGGVTATASFRFAKWLPQWFAQTACKVIIGKGGMSAAHYRDIFVPAGAIYLTTVGYGTGALLGRGIKSVENACWLDELGIAQAMWVLRVEDFGPLLVESDLEGNSLFETNNKEINAKIDSLYEGLKKPALSRFGETDDKTDELI